MVRLTARGRRVLAITGAVTGVAAIATAVIARRVSWVATADFDVVGVLWSWGNIPKLVLLGLTGFFAAASVYCWVRALVGR